MRSEIAFGVQPGHSIGFGTAAVGSILPRNKHETIVTTAKGLHVIENWKVKTSYNVQLGASVFIACENLLVGVAAQKSELYVFPNRELGKPILSRFPTNQGPVFHVLYSRKSSVVITFGSGVKIWNLRIKVDKALVSALPEVAFTLRATICESYETSILITPSFDYERELLFLATARGIVAFNLDGKEVFVVPHVSSSSKTPFTYLEEKRRILAFEAKTNELLLYNRFGVVKDRFSIGKTAILWVSFIDAENAILMDAKREFTILNVKTKQNFFCYKCDFLPGRICVVDVHGPKLCLSVPGVCNFMDIVIPWHVWVANVSNTRFLERAEKLNAAARVVVVSDNASVKMHSPRDGTLLLDAVVSCSGRPFSVLYQRGMWPDKTQVVPDLAERLYLILESGKVVIFDPTVEDCRKLCEVDMKAMFIKLCVCDNKCFYAIYTKTSTVLFCDCVTLKVTKHFNLSTNPLLNMLFEHNSQTLWLIYDKLVIVFDVKREQVLINEPINKSTCSVMSNGKLYLGFEDGSVRILQMRESGKLVGTTLDEKHTDQVSGLAFGDGFWVSVSMDGSIFFWHDNVNFSRILLPCALLAVVVLNGSRDLLVATTNALMLVGTGSVFNGACDAIHSDVDNYNELIDPLAPKEMIARIMREKQKREAEARMKRTGEMELEDRKKPKKRFLSDKARDKLRRITSQEIFVCSREFPVAPPPNRDPELEKQQRLEEMKRMTDPKSYPTSSSTEKIHTLGMIDKHAKHCDESMSGYDVATLNKRTNPGSHDNSVDPQPSSGDQSKATPEENKPPSRGERTELEVTPQCGQFLAIDTEEGSTSQQRCGREETTVQPTESERDTAQTHQQPAHKLEENASNQSENGDNNWKVHEPLPTDTEGKQNAVVRAPRHKKQQMGSTSTAAALTTDAIVSCSDATNAQDAVVACSDTRDAQNGSISQEQSAMSCNDHVVLFQHGKRENAAESEVDMQRHSQEAHNTTDSDPKPTDEGNGSTNGTDPDRKSDALKAHTSRQDDDKKDAAAIAKILEMRKRAPTPPNIRPRLSINKRLTELTRTNSQLALTRKLVYEVPKPCVRLDRAEIMKQYGRGKVELLPLVQYIRREEAKEPHCIQLFEEQPVAMNSQFPMSVRPMFVEKQKVARPRKVVRSLDLRALMRKPLPDLGSIEDAVTAKKIHLRHVEPLSHRPPAKKLRLVTKRKCV